MRTEYVIPLTAKFATYAAKLEKELANLHKQQAELVTLDGKFWHYATNASAWIWMRGEGDLWQVWRSASGGENLHWRNFGVDDDSKRRDR